MKDLLKYGLIASAGQPRNLTGEGIVALGALFTQMDFGLKSEEEELITDEPTEKYLKDKLYGNNDKDLQKEYDSAMAFDPDSVQVEDLFEYEHSDFGITVPGKKIDPPTNDGVVEGGVDGSLANQSNFLANALSKGLRGMDINEMVNRVESGERVIDAEKEIRFNKGEFYTSERNEYNDYIRRTRGINNAAGKSTPTSVGQTSTNISNLGFVESSLNRLKPEILENLEKLRYKNKGKDDTPLFRAAHVAKSAFVRTDNIDYRQMKQATAPGYTGEIGKAAAEGYNLVIDKYNYDQAVKADYEEELDDQMGSLNVPADFISDEARENYLALASGKKKQLGEAFNDWSNGKMSKLDYENKKASLTSEIKMAAAARTNVTNAIKDFMENKGLYDIDASDSEMVDFFMTGEKSPEKIFIKNIDGVDYITGTTRGGKGFKVPTSKIANGTAGFRLVKKANLAPVISGALKSISAYTTSTKTDLGFGTSTPNIEKAKEIGIASIKSSLGANEGDLRSIMAQVYGVDHTAYQNFLGSDANANKNEMLSDAAEYLYDTQVADKYFPQTKTTKFTTQQRGVSLTAGERTAAEIKQRLDKLPALSTSSLPSYASQLDMEKYELKEDPKGGFYINDFSKKRRINLANDPSQAKTQIANLAGVKGYSGPTYDAKSLIQKYK